MAVQTTLAMRSTHELTTRAVRVFPLLWDAFQRQDAAPLDVAERVLREVRRTEAMSGTPADEMVASVGDLLGSVRAMVDDAVPFTERATREINSLFDKGLELLECARDALATENRVLVRHVLETGAQYAQLANDYAMAHQQRLVDGVCLPLASTVYLGMVEHLKGVGSHTREIGEAVALRHVPTTGAH
jgi:hypothetical protein